MGQGSRKRPIHDWIHGVMMRHMPLMITCREFEDFILDYLEEDLPERQRFVFELHIKICRECRDYLKAYSRTVEVSRRVFEQEDEAIPEEVPEDLVKAVLAAKAEDPDGMRS